MSGKLSRGLAVAAAVGFAVSPWLPWYGRPENPGPVQIFGTIDHDALRQLLGTIDLWAHRTVPAVLLLAAAAAALIGALVPQTRARVATTSGAAVAAMVALALGRHVSTSANGANYVLRGHGATVYSGVTHRPHAALSTVVVLASVGSALMSAGADEFAVRRAGRSRFGTQEHER